VCYEIHFSLFCFLGDAQILGLDEAVTQQLRAFISEYIHSTPKNTAKALWMAADLLGEHWNDEHALAALLSAATNAAYADGRRAAIYGLTCRFRHASKHDRGLITWTLCEVARRDKSPKIRNRASSALDRL
jgi:hypothetical protein